MIDSAKILFRLLRAALGDETEVSLPNDVGWNEVIDLSFEQGVVAIAVEGLSKIDGLGLMALVLWTLCMEGNKNRTAKIRNNLHVNYMAFTEELRCNELRERVRYN